MRPYAVEWMLALRYLGARREEGTISLIAGFSLVGIALGVATLIVVMSVMGGFQQELLGRILALNGRLAVLAGDRGISDYEAQARRLSQIEGVVGVTPIVEGQGIATSGAKTQGILARGIAAEELAQRDFIVASMKGGDVQRLVGKRSVVVGQGLLDVLGLKVGDDLTLISSQTIATPLGLLPRTARMTIVGSFELGMYEYDTRFVFVPLEAAQALFGMPDKVTQLEIRTAGDADLPRIENEVGRLAPPASVVVNWERSNQGFFAVVRTQASVLFLILALIIVVAAFNIVSSLFILVKTKSAEIGILRTIGASRGLINRVFVLAGLIVGGLGTAAGLVIGVLFSANIETLRQWLQGLLGVELFSAKLYLLTELPSVVDAGDVIAIVVMALVLSLLAGLYPAWRAGRLDPIDALKDA
ncbi:MAG: lipoprotein-releasing ABC transporter permease subunit [Reyranellaceae bacterium]